MLLFPDSLVDIGYDRYSRVYQNTNDFSNKCKKEGRRMVKKTLSILLIVILTLFGLSGCNKQDKYEWQGCKWEDIIALFGEQRSMFIEIADIFATNDSYWEQCRQYEDDSTAWIMSPYDEEKMGVFNIDDQEIITRFFDQTHPYQILVKNWESVTITYINEEKTDAFLLTYCYDYRHSRDEWIAYIKGMYPDLIDLGDNWFIYRTEESSHQ